MTNVVIKNFKFPAEYGITLHDVSEVKNHSTSETTVKCGDRYYVFEQIACLERLALVLDIANGRAVGVTPDGTEYDTYRSEHGGFLTHHNPKVGHTTLSIDDMSFPITRHRPWVEVRTIEDARLWIGKCVEIKYKGLSPYTCRVLYLKVAKTIDFVCDGTVKYLTILPGSVMIREVPT